MTDRQEVLQNRLGPQIQELKAQAKTILLVRSESAMQKH